MSPPPPPPPLPSTIKQRSPFAHYSQDPTAQRLNRQSELDDLRRKGLAKAFNRHFTSAAEAIAREREAAESALLELERRKEGRSDAQFGDGENVCGSLDRLYQELWKRKEEVRRKERETQELYRRYAAQYGDVVGDLSPSPPASLNGPPQAISELPPVNENGQMPATTRPPTSWEKNEFLNSSDPVIGEPMSQFDVPAVVGRTPILHRPSKKYCLGSDIEGNDSGSLTMASLTITTSSETPPRSDDDSEMSGLTFDVETLHSQFLSEAENRLSDFLKHETDNIRQMIGQPESDDVGTVKSVMTEEGRAAQQAATEAEDLAKRMAEAAKALSSGESVYEDDEVDEIEKLKSMNKCPPGWREVWSEEHRDKYYHNIETGETTWSLPDSSVKKDEGPKTRINNCDMDDESTVVVRDYTKNKSTEPYMDKNMEFIDQFRPDCGASIVSRTPSRRHRRNRSFTSNDDDDYSVGSMTSSGTSLKEYRLKRRKMRRRRRVRVMIAVAAVSVAGVGVYYIYGKDNIRDSLRGFVGLDNGEKEREEAARIQALKDLEMEEKRRIAEEAAAAQAKREAEEKKAAELKKKMKLAAAAKKKLEIERKKKELEAQRKKEAEEAARRLAAEKKAREEAAAKEKARKEAELKAKKKAEEEKARKIAEERAKAKKLAEEKARKEAEEKARLLAEARAKKEAEEKKKAQIIAQAEARKRAEDRARQEAEEKARLAAEARARKVAEQKARKEAAEAKARKLAEAKALKEAQERARREAEEKEKVRLMAEAKAKKEAEETLRREAEEKARKEKEVLAKIQAEEKAQKEAEEKARVEKLEVERKARVEEEMRIELARLEAEQRAREEEQKREIALRLKEERKRGETAHQLKFSEEEETASLDSGKAWPKSCAVPFAHLFSGECSERASERPLFDVEELLDSMMIL